MMLKNISKHYIIAMEIYRIWEATSAFMFGTFNEGEEKSEDTTIHRLCNCGTYDDFSQYMTPMECMGGYTSIDYLKRCYRYNAAKSGNIAAAIKVCQKCINQDDINDIRRKYPESMLLPVISNGSALALSLAMHIKLPIWCVCSASNRNRKNMYAMERILNRPLFEGYIQKDRSYIIVDDVVTQGGTVMSLRQYVIDAGGRVDGVVAIAYAKGSRTIVPTKESIEKLLSRFGTDIYDFFRDVGVSSPVQLSYSQIRYLLSFASIDNMREKAGEYTKK
jgi:hypoxanthine-guanine phosphoribosyltransferase